MSRYVFNHISGELEYSKPTGVEIPGQAFRMNAERVIVEQGKRTSILLIALVVLLIVVLILVLIYLLWLIFVKTAEQTPASFFSFITGRG